MSGRRDSAGGGRDRDGGADRGAGPNTPPLTVERALAMILDATPALPPQTVTYHEAAGRILLEEIRADRDHPEFDKSLMDGYAVSSADLTSAPRELRVTEEIPAGTDPAGLRRVETGAAARIMTGAPLPPGADAVLVVERTEPVEGRPGHVRALQAVTPGDNLARRGDDVRRGEALLAPGDFIGPAEIAVLASCGRTRVRVGGVPRVAVLSTGDELVAPEEAPGPGRIRNSNGPLLAALARRAGADVRDAGIAADDEARLRDALTRGLEADLLLVSGGVSMGVYDLVSDALRAIGIDVLFERVAIKPGRPFTFGHRGGRLVFGCPGNPASCYVIFQVFARPALRRMMGHPAPAPAPARGVLENAVRQRPDRAAYHQARARFAGGRCAVRVLPTSGSADFVSCARGNALAVVPPGDATMAAGEEIDVMLLDDHADR